jgi:U3 small nucleolar RNA-associated protein 5
LLGNTAETNGDASKTPQKTKTKTVSGDNVHVSGMKSDLNTKVEELTFAERLGQPAASKTPEKSAGKVGVAASADGKVPKVASNVAVLSAALASNDRQQLQTVLDQQDQRVISATVKGLPLSSILPLLLELMNRFSRKPAANTAAWLRYVLITHQAYLTSLPNLINRLSGLYNTLDDRLKYFPDLLRLHGRFELVLSHMELNKSASADDTAPFNTYVEGADDEDFDEDSDDDVDDDEEFDDDDDDEDDEEEGAGRKKPEDMDVDSDEQDEKQSGSDEDDSEGSDE